MRSFQINFHIFSFSFVKKALKYLKLKKTLMCNSNKSFSKAINK